MLINIIFDSFVPFYILFLFYILLLLFIFLVNSNFYLNWLKSYLLLWLFCGPLNYEENMQKKERSWLLLNYRRPRNYGQQKAREAMESRPVREMPREGSPTNIIALDFSTHELEANKEDIHLVWDLENCQIPFRCQIKEIFQNIRLALG